MQPASVGRSFRWLPVLGAFTCLLHAGRASTCSRRPGREGKADIGYYGLAYCAVEFRAHRHFATTALAYRATDNFIVGSRRAQSVEVQPRKTCSLLSLLSGGQCPSPTVRRIHPVFVRAGRAGAMLDASVRRSPREGVSDKVPPR